MSDLTWVLPPPMRESASTDASLTIETPIQETTDTDTPPTSDPDCQVPSADGVLTVDSLPHKLWIREEVDWVTYRIVPHRLQDETQDLLWLWSAHQSMLPLWRRIYWDLERRCLVVRSPWHWWWEVVMTSTDMAWSVTLPRQENQSVLNTLKGTWPLSHVQEWTPPTLDPTHMLASECRLQYHHALSLNVRVSRGTQSWIDRMMILSRDLHEGEAVVLQWGCVPVPHEWQSDTQRVWHQFDRTHLLPNPPSDWKQSAKQAMIREMGTMSLDLVKLVGHVVDSHYSEEALPSPWPDTPPLQHERWSRAKVQFPGFQVVFRLAVQSDDPDRQYALMTSLESLPTLWRADNSWIPSVIPPERVVYRMLQGRKNLLSVKELNVMMQLPSPHQLKLLPTMKQETKRMTPKQRQWPQQGLFVGETPVEGTE